MDKVILAIDRKAEIQSVLKNKRIGLITNPTGMNSRYESTIDVFKDELNLKALYSPEHGVRGDIQAGEKVSSYVDKRSGVPVFSLYGESKRPSKEMLADIDVMVIDIQDAGSRFYTYIYTMAYCMMGCKEQGKEFVVLDRPNPINGIEVEGGLIEEGFTSFIGLYPIPQRYGLTIGELAMLFNEEFGINCHLTVIPMDGWRREMYFEDTDLPWIMPSPNMPTLNTALVYNGTCIFEGTNISEGRGTTKPFEIVGAPWIDAHELSRKMNLENLPGVKFRPVYFTPTFSKHKDVMCGGVELIINDKESFKPVLTGVTLLEKIKSSDEEKFCFLEAYSKSGRPMIDYNTGSSLIRKGILTPLECYRRWLEETKHFKAIKEKYHIY
ncbi:exo-beta-N-acetylmuramidase NamZ family protein [Clostridium polynesiense]|uniref:exo-beta-N-acetylmuramidase NamZ family protein n=1 Tax=Clostridium polynesiense TaxID=1325933 RepID=UPI00058DB8A4|nr:DUF1343 domain-containing protein [Clostridium polynesiense]